MAMEESTQRVCESTILSFGLIFVTDETQSGRKYGNLFTCLQMFLIAQTKMQP